ncbi:MAG TPA: 16S rRNA (cytosine(1402)-N(4))-methyltransferase RsmH [Bacteroidota bacterium]|nr:16S rRNA (cytosine(1402)-N(4))-methyltransferase RsmH [Bacteroidota bacterium]
MFHIPVLVNEVLQYLVTAPDGTYVDGTLGGGGHTEELLKRLSPNGRVIGFDRDADAISAAQARLARFDRRFFSVHEDVGNLRRELSMMGISSVHGLLLDLGVSSHQLDEGSRGFSYQRDARIDMRMDTKQQSDGWGVVNTYPEDRLSGLFREYGEERYARRVARAVAKARQIRRIDTTAELAKIVETCIPGKTLQQSLSRIFQAIRIEVNHELESLQAALRGILEILVPGGRIVVISYHSLEDRVVKEFFRDEASTKIRSVHKLIPDQPREPRLKVLTKKPVGPTADEIRSNQRARSAKLRAAERV